MTKYQQVLRANIAAELGHRGFTQQDASRRLDLSRQAFSSRMRGDTEFRLGELVALARFLGVSMTVLIDGLDRCDDVSSVGAA